MKLAKTVMSLTLGLALSASVYADGAAKFAQGGCTACHQPAVDTAGPSLKAISAAYKGNEAALISFLAGKGAPKLATGRFAGQFETLMKPQVANGSAKWTAAERIDVAKHIMKK